jgi:hypothetical protein
VIKFGKAVKTGQSSFVFQNIRFRQFQSRRKQEGKREDFEAQDNLKHGKGVRSIKESR